MPHKSSTYSSRELKFLPNTSSWSKWSFVTLHLGEGSRGSIKWRYALMRVQQHLWEVRHRRGIDLQYTFHGYSDYTPFNVLYYSNRRVNFLLTPPNTLKPINFMCLNLRKQIIFGLKKNIIKFLIRVTLQGMAIK